MKPTQSTPDQPTPVADDAQATAPQLLTRAQQDYAVAQDRREARAAEDRVNGQQSGSTT